MNLTRQEKRAQAVALKQQGISNNDIAVATGLSVRGIQKINRRVKHTHSFKDQPRSGRPAKLTDRNKRMIARMVKKKETSTASAISRALKTTHSISVCPDTVKRSLKSLGVRVSNQEKEAQTHRETQKGSFGIRQEVRKLDNR